MGCSAERPITDDPEAFQTGLGAVVGVMAAVSRAVQVALVTFAATRITVTRYPDRDAPDLAIVPKAAPRLLVLDDGTAAIAFGNDTLHLTDSQYHQLAAQIRNEQTFTAVV